MRHIVLAAPVDGPALADLAGTTSSVVTPTYGGTIATAIVRELVDRGHHVDVVTLSRDLAAGTVEEHAGDRLRLVIAPSRDAGRARDAFRSERDAIAEVVGGAPTSAVVHAHWTYEFALGAMRPRPDTIVTLHDWAPRVLSYHRDAYRAVRLGMQVACLRRARTLTAVSPYLADLVRRWARRDAEVIPNGLSPDRFVTDPAPPPSGPPVLLGINDGFGRRKNVGALLTAFPLVRQRHPDAVLRLVGGGYGPDEAAHQWATQEGLTDGVEFVGRVPADTIATQVDGCTALVHPSREETFGLVLLEAMARGRPVVGGRHAGAVPWVLRDGAGLLVDVESSQAIADAASRLLAPDGSWQATATAGHQRAQDFRLPAVVDQYEALWDRVAP